MAKVSVSSALSVVRRIHKDRKEDYHWGQGVSRKIADKQKRKMYRETKLRALEKKKKKIDQQIKAIEDKYNTQDYDVKMLVKARETEEYNNVQAKLIEHADNPKKCAQIIKAYQAYQPQL